MSFIHYLYSIRIASQNYPFYGILMAARQQAPPEAQESLRTTLPSDLEISDFERTVAHQLIEQGYPYEALIMACIRQADTMNCEALQALHPGIFSELLTRYHASGGLLPGEDDNEARELRVKILQEGIMI